MEHSARPFATSSGPSNAHQRTWAASRPTASPAMPTLVAAHRGAVLVGDEDLGSESGRAAAALLHGDDLGELGALEVQADITDNGLVERLGELGVEQEPGAAHEQLRVFQEGGCEGIIEVSLGPGPTKCRRLVLDLLVTLGSDPPEPVRGKALEGVGRGRLVGRAVVGEKPGERRLRLGIRDGIVAPPLLKATERVEKQQRLVRSANTAARPLSDVGHSAEPLWLLCCHRRTVDLPTW